MVLVQTVSGEVNIETAGPSGDAPVVLLHALGTDLHLWDGVASILSVDHRTIQIDLRGHGLTPATAGPYSLDLLADDVASVICQLNLDAVHLAGISLGGAVAQRLAGRRPRYLRSAILCDTDMVFSPAALWAERARTARESGLESLVEPSLARWVTERFRHTPAADGLRATLRCTSTEGYAGAAEALMAADLAASVAQIAVPSLVLVGECDQSTPVARAALLCDAIPQARLHVFPELAHLPPAEAPAEVAAAMLSFLAPL